LTIEIEHYEECYSLHCQQKEQIAFDSIPDLESTKKPTKINSLLRFHFALLTNLCLSNDKNYEDSRDHDLPLSTDGTSRIEFDATVTKIVEQIETECDDHAKEKIRHHRNG
jgi:hypothetical protein